MVMLRRVHSRRLVGLVVASADYNTGSRATPTDNPYLVSTELKIKKQKPDLMHPRFVPESPRFLVAKGMESKAAKTLAKYHANSGDEHDPLIVFEMAQIRHALKLEKEIKENSSFWQLWTRPGNLKRLRIIVAIAMFSQWR